MGKSLSNTKNHLRIEDWTGKVLFRGHNEDPEVERILKLNEAPNDDIYLYWEDETDERNPWECVNW